LQRKLQNTLRALNDLAARKAIMPKEIDQSAHARRLIAVQENKAGELLDEGESSLCQVWRGEASLEVAHLSRRRSCSTRGHVRFRHKADILNALTNVRIWGRADIDQPLLNNLDLRVHGLTRGSVARWARPHTPMSSNLQLRLRHSGIDKTDRSGT
jgi:hypothetical protein